MSWLENREHRVAKKRVVAEASRLDVSAAQIARRYDPNAKLLFNWRKKYALKVRLLRLRFCRTMTLAIRITFLRNWITLDRLLQVAVRRTFLRLISRPVKLSAIEPGRHP